MIIILMNSSNALHLKVISIALPNLRSFPIINSFHPSLNLIWSYLGVLYTAVVMLPVTKRIPAILSPEICRLELISNGNLCDATCNSYIDLPSEYRGVLVFLAAIATESDTAWAPPAIGSSFLAATATGTLEVTLLSAGLLAPPRKIWFHSMYLIMVRFDATETSFNPWVRSTSTLSLSCWQGHWRACSIDCFTMLSGWYSPTCTHKSYASPKKSKVVPRTGVITFSVGFSLQHLTAFSIVRWFNLGAVFCSVRQHQS